jgi:hypothetical protein
VGKLHRVADPEHYTRVDGIWVPRVGGGAGFTFVKGAGNAAWSSGTGNTAENASGGTSQATSAFGSNNVAGNMLLVVAASWNATGGSITSVTDTAGNTWSSGNSWSTGVLSSGHSIDFWWVPSCAGAGNTVTVHYGVTVFISVACMEYNGFAGSVALDAHGSINGVASPAAMALGTSAPAGDLIIWCWNDSNSGGAYSLSSGTLRADAATNLTTAIGELLSGAAGTNSNTLTSSAHTFSGGVIALSAPPATPFAPTLLARNPLYF